MRKKIFAVCLTFVTPIDDGAAIAVGLLIAIYLCVYVCYAKPILVYPKLTYIYIY